MSGIFLKLLRSHLLVIIISFLILTLIISIPLKKYYRDSIGEKMETSGKLTSELIEHYIYEDKVSELQPLIIKLGEKINARITVTDLEGNVLGDSKESPSQMENHRNHPEIKEAISGKIGRTIRYSKTTKIDMMYVAVPVDGPAGRLGVVRISMPLSVVKGRINHIQKIIIICIIVGIIVALVLSVITSSSFARPLIKMKETAQQMINGSYEKRLDIHTRDELGQLAESFNILFDEIQKNISGIVADKEKLSTILASMIEGVLVLDNENKVITVNSSFTRMLRIETSDIEGLDYKKLIPDERIAAHITKALSTGEAFSEELSIKNPQRQVFLLQLSYINSSEGASIGTVVVFHDITPFKKLEMLKSEFIANVSHEIKTPVTAIIASVETLLSGAVENKMAAYEFLKIINSHSIRLNNIVNDLLILSKLESEDVELEMRNLKLDGIICYVAEMFQESANDHGITLNVDMPAELNEVYANEKKIEQVFINLIDNALKFSSKDGTVNISARNEEKRVIVKISDTGIGIPSEHLERIFERFYRVDSARSREMGGTGLGLSIVKHIMQLHKGEVSVSSKPGKCTEFILDFPAQV